MDDRSRRCSMCRAELTPDNARPGVLRKGGYCRSCNAAYMRDYDKRKARETPRPCVMCGLDFTRWDDWVGGGAHSTRCRPCYGEYTRQRQRIKRLPVSRRTLPQVETPFGLVGLKDSGRPTGPAWRRLRMHVIESSSTCGICGGEVDKSAEPFTALSPSVDHIVPIADGGHPTELRNLRLTHHACNSRAGADRSNRLRAERRVSYSELIVAMVRAGL